jgi:hypothetical protein
MPRSRLLVRPRGRPRRPAARPRQRATDAPGPVPRAVAASSSVPETQLLQAVLAQALRDLRLTRQPHIRRAALAFWRSEHGSLDVICELLGTDAGQVRARLAAQYPEVG